MENSNNLDTTEKELKKYRKNQQATEKLHKIISDPKLGSEEKIRKIIDLGRERLGLPIGFITDIDIDESIQKIIYSTDDGKIKEGTEEDLSNTYCRKTIKKDNVHVIRNSIEEGWNKDPSYEIFGLECYVGSKIETGGKLYGTICFGSYSEVEKEFGKIEKLFVKTLSNLLGYELENIERRKQIGILNRVFRHNIRNKIGIIDINARGIEKNTKGNLRKRADTILRNADEILKYSEKIKEIDKIISQNEFQLRNTNIKDKIQISINRIIERYPDININTNIKKDTYKNKDTKTDTEVNINVEVDTEDINVYSIDSIDKAIEEVIENSIIHGNSKDPKININVYSDKENVHLLISDNGPGIPQEEIDAIKGFEDPLTHSSGLGLWLIYWTVSKSKGKLKFKEKKNSENKNIEIKLQKAT